MKSMGSVFIGLGVLLVVVGLVLTFANYIPGVGSLGNLPGDIHKTGPTDRFIFPSSLAFSSAFFLPLYSIC